MPEGDTVYRAARMLDRALTGQELTVSDFRVPQLATTDLVGATVTGTVSRGKHLLTRIDGGPDRGGESWTLHTHLKMEGAWRVHQPGQRWQRPAYQARVVLATRSKVAVGFSLGIVELLARDREDEAVGHLGPDLLTPAAQSLAEAAHRGSLGRLTVEKADGEQLLGAGATPWRVALQDAGFVSTPKGLRFRA